MVKAINYIIKTWESHIRCTINKGTNRFPKPPISAALQRKRSL